VTGRHVCPRERFASLDEARTALAQRRARAVISGIPRPPEEAYACRHCDGAHLRRAPRTHLDAGRSRPAADLVAA